MRGKWEKILFCRGKCMRARIKTGVLLTQTLLRAHVSSRESDLLDEICRLEIFSRILSLEQLMRSSVYHQN